MTAALTPLPVFGVPVGVEGVSGVDSLHSIVQMPAGIPGRDAGDRPGRGDQCRPPRRGGPRASTTRTSPARLDVWRAAQASAVAERPAGDGA